jgi:hypothetical protein
MANSYFKQKPGEGFFYPGFKITTKRMWADVGQLGYFFQGNFLLKSL